MLDRSQAAPVDQAPERSSGAEVDVDADAGAPLPLWISGPMGSALGDDFGDVRLHLGLPSRSSVRPGARAVTSGRHVHVDAREYAPTTLTGQLVLAHELAHVRQPVSNGATDAAAETDADRSALRAVIEMGNPALDGLPTDRIGPLLGGAQPSASRRGALSLAACSRELPRDWEGQGNDRAETAARTIRSRFVEREELLGRETLTEADHRRLDQLESELREQIAVLRELGIRLPVDELYRRIVDETPMADLMRVGVERIIGAEPPTLIWGERRQFEAVTGYLPPAVDVRYRWRVMEDATERAIPDAPSSSSTAELSPLYWRRAAEWEYRRMSPGFSHLRVGVSMEVGANRVDRKWTPAMSVRHELPDSLSISISPMAPRPVGDPPDAPPRVLAGTQATASPSWLPRSLPGHADSYNIWWEIRRGRDLIKEGWGMYGGGKLEDPGRYRFTAAVHAFPTILRRPERPALRRAQLDVDVVSTRTLADESFGLVKSQMEGLEYGEYTSELAARVRQADLVRRAGSTEQSEVDERYEALVEMQAEVRRHMETTSEWSMSSGSSVVGGMPLSHRYPVESTRRRSTAPLPFPASEHQFDRLSYYARVLPAVFVHPTVGIPQPLTIFTQIHHDGIQWRAKLVDATTRDVVRHEGRGAHPYAAVVDAISDWRDDNEYPKGGHVRYQFSPFPTWNLAGTFSTDSWEKTILEWFDTVLFVVGAVVGILLLLTPEPTGLTKAAGYAVLAATILRGVYGIYQSLDLGRPALHERHILEAVGIIASVIGLRGGMQAAAAARTAAQGEALVGRALTQFNVGRGMVYMSAATDAGTFVYATAEAWPAIRRALDEDESNDDQAALLRIVGQLALQGILIIGTNRDLFRGMPARGTGGPGVVGALAAEGGVHLPPEGRTRIEGELPSLGVADDLSGLSDLDLLARYQRALGGAHGDVVAAARATGVDDYVAALRRPGAEPGDVGGRWDWSRFQGYPEGQRWQPGDPIDAPHRTRDGQWVYPDYNAQGRYRYWRNRAHYELEARQAGRRQRNPQDASDPIRAMSDEDLRAMRANNAPTSPRTARGRVVELEHSGVPQRVTRMLEELGFPPSEARRISRASDPGNLMPVDPLEHAFFDAYAQYRDAHAESPRMLNRQRTDAQGRTWEYTLLGDERVHRPFAMMSDDEFRGLLDAIQRGAHDANFGRSDATRRLRNWLQREGRARGIPVPF